MSDPDREIVAIDARIPAIENQYLQEVFACDTIRQVETAVTYASYLNRVGLSPENYPVFLRMLDIENHWVIDALIGNNDPAALLSAVQPNQYTVGRILSMVKQWRRGGIFAKNLAVILGVLQSVYSSPRDGLEVHVLAISDVNAIAKHLDKKKGQDDALNRAILELLDKLSALADGDDLTYADIGVQAGAIKNTFLDDRKSLEDAIPSDLLLTAEERSEVAPRNQAPFDEGSENRKKE